MLKLDKLDKEILKKLESLLGVVRDAIELDGRKPERIIVPKVNFENKGLLLGDVTTLLNRIEREEDGLLSVVAHSPLDHQPRRSLNDHLMIEAIYGVSADEHYAEKKQKYNEIYSKSFDIKFSDYKTLLDFEKKVETAIDNLKYLACGELVLNLETGDVEYYDIKTHLAPKTQLFKLLRALLKDKDHKMNYDEIVAVLSSGHRKEATKKDRDRIPTDIYKIKSSLGMTPAGAKELGLGEPMPDIFESDDGYRIICP